MQLKFNVNGSRWGGRREGSGRVRIHSQGVAHSVREKVCPKTPLHVNFRYKGNIRNKDTLWVLKRAIRNSRKHGLKILHFSFQSNHIHLIVEALNNEILTRGMRSLTITMAKGINRGRIQIGRYHLHVLKSVREVQNALHYILFNQQKHEKGIYTKIDEYSSLLDMPKALILIRNFAKERKITVCLSKGVPWESDKTKNYLMNKGSERLYGAK